MPKLRDRSLIAAKQLESNQESVSHKYGKGRCWTEEETEILMSAVKAHGTYSMEKLQEALPKRTPAQVKMRLKQLRRKHLPDLQSTPLDDWLDRLAGTLPSAHSNIRAPRNDMAALSVPLVLAAAEEHAQATMHRRQDFSEVYTYLAHLVNGVIPPEPSGPTSRRLLALMQHLAALMKTVDLTRHQRWVWNSARARRLEHEHLGPAEAKSEAAARDNLSLAPPPLRDALAGLSAPSVNGLDIPPALLLSPLAARLREDVGANRHDLLAMPIHKMLAMARFQGWSASHIDHDDPDDATMIDAIEAVVAAQAAQSTATPASAMVTSAAGPAAAAAEPSTSAVGAERPATASATMAAEAVPAAIVSASTAPVTRPVAAVPPAAQAAPFATVPASAATTAVPMHTVYRLVPMDTAVPGPTVAAAGPVAAAAAGPAAAAGIAQSSAATATAPTLSAAEPVAAVRSPQSHVTPVSGPVAMATAVRLGSLPLATPSVPTNLAVATSVPSASMIASASVSNTRTTAAARPVTASALTSAREPTPAVVTVRVVQSRVASASRPAATTVRPTPLPATQAVPKTMVVVRAAAAARAAKALSTTASTSTSVAPTSKRTKRPLGKPVLIKRRKTSAARPSAKNKTATAAARAGKKASTAKPSAKNKTATAAASAGKKASTAKPSAKNKTVTVVVRTGKKASTAKPSALKASAAAAVTSSSLVATTSAAGAAAAEEAEPMDYASEESGLFGIPGLSPDDHDWRRSPEPAVGTSSRGDGGTSPAVTVATTSAPAKTVSAPAKAVSVPAPPALARAPPVLTRSPFAQPAPVQTAPARAVSAPTSAPAPAHPSTSAPVAGAASNVSDRAAQTYTQSELPFAVRGRGAVKTYTRKRWLPTPHSTTQQHE